jgi:hypothetical protein
MVGLGHGATLSLQPGNVPVENDTSYGGPAASYPITSAECPASEPPDTARTGIRGRAAELCFWARAHVRYTPHGNPRNSQMENSTIHTTVIQPK